MLPFWDRMPQSVKLYSAIICCRDSFANPLLQEAHNAILRSRKKDSTPLRGALPEKQSVPIPF
jgi:hypothetical protein